MSGPIDRTHPYARPERSGAVPLVSPGQLRSLAAGPGPPWLLDVRRARERAFAHLPEDHSIPLSELPRRLGELPRDRPIIAYCQYGNEARRAAAYLARCGVNGVAALEGGLDEYARTVEPAMPRYRADEPEELAVRQMPRSDTGCLSYLLSDPIARTAVIVDPGREVAPYLAALAEGHLRLAAIIETHTHADHLAGHAELAHRTGAPIYLGRRSPAAYPHRVLAEGEEVAFAGGPLVAYETPGHTRDHLTLRLGNFAFTGDTLLLGSCGRTDLGDGDPEALWESLTERILRWPDETEILPAHFGAHHALPGRLSSSLGFERAVNEAIQQPDRAAFVRYMSEGWPPRPTDFDEIVRENLTR